VAHCEPGRVWVVRCVPTNRGLTRSPAAALWAELDTANNALADALGALSEKHAIDPPAYDALIARLAAVPAAQWPADATALLAAHAAALRIRAGMRTLSARAGVPVEPAAQSALLDACAALPGVLGGGVPGAGGYDALWVLVLGDAPSAAVERTWAGWTEMRVAPLLAGEAVEAGCRVEDVGVVRGLKEAIGF
jgi:phosphomevalonate kinase